ncbi:MAG: hypothetical protein WBE20_04620 [Candidatus Acidiferrales bacterium]
MHDPLIQYLVGTCILSVGLVIWLSAPDIAYGLSHFWERWIGKRTDDSGAAPRTIQPPSYRARLIIWRTIGTLILLEGLVWLVLATSGAFHLMPHAKP